MASDKECKADLLAALQVLDIVRVTAWHRTNIQEYRCNLCGGIGAYPRSIEHHADCMLKKGATLVEKYREWLISSSC